MGVARHEIVEFDLRRFGGSALTSRSPAAAMTPGRMARRAGAATRACCAPRGSKSSASRIPCFRNMRLPLAEVIALVEAEGARLRAEFYLPRGPRGERGSAPIDREIEERLRAKLQALVPGTFCGEGCETVTGE